MLNQPTDNDNIKNALESLENTTEAPSNNEVTGVEVLKGDKVMYEDGDFEDYNAEKQIESDKEGKSAKEDQTSKEDKSNEKDESNETNENDESNENDKSEKNDKYSATIANIFQWASKLKDEFISDKDGKSDANEKETSGKSDKDDKHSATIDHIYQWASKLKDDFTSEASNMTHEVSEKALAMMLNRLVDGVEAELKAFDKKVENFKESVPNAAEERSKISDKKDKYQSMLDQLRN
ncbi:hypothetical protein [Psychrobacter sp. ANT_H3]|uniref:hypothetical protein n=1 Tax=Psychrobacter sp. ANT_H3 TaxID=3019444 RepID=UPI0022F149E8|nr:hypothetical protein [Psychrobacter sp. ANT_H3]MDA5132364.1 hypothetical protein [Psychrobacter sp. ANT_H3]